LPALSAESRVPGILLHGMPCGGKTACALTDFALTLERDLPGFQWGKVFGALTGHTGLGRVIMTSRRAPAGAPDAIAKHVPAGARSEASGGVGRRSDLRVLIDMGQVSHVFAEVQRLRDRIDALPAPGSATTSRCSASAAAIRH
jgi:hypothetical protein